MRYIEFVGATKAQQGKTRIVGAVPSGKTPSREVSQAFEPALKQVSELRKGAIRTPRKRQDA